MIEANQQTEQTVEKQDKPQVITVSQIIIDLDNGLGRPQIKEKYSLNADEIKHLFQHPSLKKRRPKRALNKINFTLVDDVTPEQDENQLRVDTEAERASDNTDENGNEFDTFEIID